MRNKIKIFIFLILIFNIIFIVSCQEDNSNQSNMLRDNSKFIYLQFEDSYNVGEDIKAKFKYADVSGSYKTYEGISPEIGDQYQNDLMRVVVLNGEKYGDLINDDNMLRITKDLHFDSFITKPVYELRQFGKIEYKPLNEDLRKINTSKRYEVIETIQYNHEVNIIISNELITGECGRLYIVGLFMQTQELRDFDLDIFDRLFDIENYEDVKNIKDKEGNGIFIIPHYVVYDYTITNNTIKFEIVDIDYVRY